MADFPPPGPVTLQQVIKSYLYVQYNDDDALQAFIDAFNAMAQAYVEAFNDLNLPVYTQLEGDLLDWVGQGLYGLSRPVLPLDTIQQIGPLNTWALNTIPLNTILNEAVQQFIFTPSPGIGFFIIGESPIGGTLTPSPANYVTNDDSYQRVLTWNFFKGDGRVFNIRWLKRRIQRFLDGVSGTNADTSETYRISVSFGSGNQVDIRIIRNTRTIATGAIPNVFTLNTVMPNQLSTENAILPPVPEAPILKAAIASGAAALPFQFQYVVTI